MLRLRQLLPLSLAAILLCLAHRLAYPEAASQWACTDNESTCKSVSIVHNSWHAAIVLRKSELAETTMPELADFPAADFIEFSWGDKDYFPDPQSGVFGAIKAALWSSGSVIHLVGFTDTVERFYRGANIAELRLNRPPMNAWSLTSTKLSCANNHLAARAPLRGCSPTAAFIRQAAVLACCVPVTPGLPQRWNMQASRSRLFLSSPRGIFRANWQLSSRRLERCGLSRQRRCHRTAR